MAGLASILGLAACGYQPVLAPGGAGAGLVGRVTLAPPRDRYDFELVAALEERLGRASDGDWVLEHDIRVNSVRVAVTQQLATTRYNLVGEAEFRLRELASRKIAAEGTVSSFISYSASGTVIATEAARRDAEERLMRVLADAIVTRLYAEFARQGA